MGREAAVMDIELGKCSFMPMYRQMAEYMYGEILSGRWEKGKRLPPEPELAQRFNTNRSTLRKALRILVERGLISQVKKQGTFVCHSQTSGGNKRRVGIISGSRTGNVMRDLYYSVVVVGIEGAFADVFADYELLLLQRRPEKDIVAQAKDERLDAVIDIATRESTYFPEQLNSFPHVLVDCGQRGNFVSVSIDYQSSYRRQLEHLIKFGHRDIVTVVSFPDDLATIEAVFLENCLPVPPPLLVPREHADEAGVAQVVDQVLRERPPTAFFFCSYPLACAGYAHLKKLGIKIPGDISVAGVGNYQRILSGIDVEFMSTEQPVRELGEIAGRMLLSQLSGAALPQRQRILECQLLPKPTVAPVAANVLA